MMMAVLVLLLLALQSERIHMAPVTESHPTGGEADSKQLALEEGLTK